MLKVFSPLPPVIENVKLSPSASDALTDPTPVPLEEFSSILNVWLAITGALLSPTSLTSLILTVMVADVERDPSLTSTVTFKDVLVS